MRKPPKPPGADEGYARYALALLIVVYVFNFLDRQILSILAERIKADLNLTDAQIGFLYGTAFAIFYALFGLPLGRLADVWSRSSLIAVGLSFWSVMTGASALARNFAQLSLARIGVGVGEASASPAAFSLLSDYFPPSKRASVLALYSSGIYIGAGLGLFIGGLIVDRWDAAFAGQVAPFGLKGWQVAFLAVGSPGLLLALWVRTLREPVRGQSEGVVEAPPRHPHPFREFGLELRAVLPLLSLLHLVLLGAKRSLIATNLGAALLVALLAWLMIEWLGTPAQWIALGIGVYAAISWAQGLSLRDEAAYRVIVHTPTLRFSAIGFALLAFTGYGIGFWLPPFFIRVHGVSETSAGLILGSSSALSGWLGATIGGLWADRWHRTARGGKLYVAMACAVLPLPLALWVLFTDNTNLAFVIVFPLGVMTSLWLGPGASTVQDLVPPRMRSVASAAYLLVVTFIGLALGPYTVGRLSVALGSLREAMALALSVDLIAFLMLGLASRRIGRDRHAARQS